MLEDHEHGLGWGPAVALYVHGHEVLRFDCFGEGGHYHFIHFIGSVELGAQEHRLFFLKKTRTVQIERAEFELE